MLPRRYLFNYNFQCPYLHRNEGSGLKQADIHIDGDGAPCIGHMWNGSSQSYYLSLLSKTSLKAKYTCKTIEKAGKNCH